MEGKPDRLLTFETAQFRQFDHGYAVTSHSAQGLTADRVLANFDTDSNHNLINTRLAYVAISRASQEAHVYTNDAQTLSLRLASDVSKTSAIQVLSQTGPEQFKSSRVPQATELGVEGPSLSI
jgi:ATP-dependent exoDNAse (exonuclease V) alpha subunit